MSEGPEQLLANNRDWATRMEHQDPGVFGRLAQEQRPQYLWIGCSDSRVPANEIVGLPPGGVFVHRNVANVILHTDLNCLAVVEFALKVLKVRHVIVCGHYNCGGVAAAMKGEQMGFVGHWIRGIRDLYESFADELQGLEEKAALARLCEINVVQQLRSLCHTNVVRDVWDDGQDLSVHGWIYGIEDGLLKDVGVTVDGAAGLEVLDQSWRSVTPPA